MEHSSQQAMAQPSQQKMIDGLPHGYPPMRDQLDGTHPMASDLQRRLAEISKQNLGECPEGSQARAYMDE